MSIISINILMGIKAASPLQKHINGRAVRVIKFILLRSKKKLKGYKQTFFCSLYFFLFLQMKHSI